MKSNIIITPTIGLTKDEWLSFRSRGVGGSDVGCIMGLSPYKSSLELYYQKIGAIQTFDIENMSMFLGKEQEDFVGSMWEYWEGSEESVIANYRDGRKVRRCKKINGYIQNDLYPWLFVSLDREINKQGEKGNGTLEIKLINSWEADKWESGIPPAYIAQVNCQMLVAEYEFGEMAILEDNRKFFVYPFEKSEIIQNHIIRKTKDFWDRVIAGRKFVNEKYLPENQFNQRKLQELDHEIDKLAPEPDGTLTYSNYLKEKFGRPLEAERKGSDMELGYAMIQRSAAEEIKEIEATKLKAENSLKNAMGDRVQMLDFGPAGRVYWSKTAAGHRVFRNKIK